MNQSPCLKVKICMDLFLTKFAFFARIDEIGNKTAQASDTVCSLRMFVISRLINGMCNISTYVYDVAKASLSIK